MDINQNKNTIGRVGALLVIGAAVVWLGKFTCGTGTGGTCPFTGMGSFPRSK